MKKINISILLLIIAVTILVNLITFYESRKIYQTEDLDMFISVSNYTGFNADTGAIFFGTVPPAGKATRMIRIATGEKPSKVVIQTEGDMARWVTLANTTMLLAPNETIEIPVSAIIPENVSYGFYTGRLRIWFFNPT